MTQIIINETTPIIVEVSTPGPQGSSGTASVGTVTTGASGSAAAVTNSGTPSAAVFNFTIPKGDIGDVTPAATAAKNAAEAAAVAAGASSTAAQSSSTSASASAAAALSSANSASASASTSTTKAQEATTSASNAAASAQSVLTASNTANTKAAEAATSASNALASANTASTKAQEASASEVISTTKAQEAVVSASTATNAATSASTSAASALSAQQVTTDNAALAIAQATIASTKATQADASEAEALVQASVATAQANISTAQAVIATAQAGISTTQAAAALASAQASAASASTSSTQAGISTTQASAASSSASNAAASATAAAASQVLAAGSATAANTSAGNASGSAANALAIYGSAAAQQAALANAQAAASVAQGFAASAASVVQQDLSGVNSAALHRSPNAVTAMLLYDTSKDSDGGAWTEKCQHTSWYNEALTGKWLGAWSLEQYAREAGAATLGAQLATGDTSNFNNLTVGNWVNHPQWPGATLNASTGALVVSGGSNYAGAALTLTTVVGRKYLVKATFTHASGVPGFFRVSDNNYSGANLAGTADGQLNTANQLTFVVTALSTTTMISVLGPSTLDDFTFQEILTSNATSNDYFQLTTDGKFYRLWKNLLTNSSAFNNGTWTKQTGVTVIDNTVAAPDGSMTGGTMDWTTCAVNQGLISSAGALNGQQNTKSIYVRADVAGGTVNLADPAITIGSTTLTLSTAWQRVSLTESGQISGAGVWLRKTATSPNTIYIAHAQLEYGALSSYEVKVANGSTSEVFRGNKRKFPKLAGIVAEAANVTIYDLTEAGRPMWMRAKASQGNDLSWGGFFSNTVLSSVSSLNGTMVIGSTNGNAGYPRLTLVDFVKDAVTLCGNGNSRSINFGNLSFRNTAGVQANRVAASPNIEILSASTNAVAMTVLPDAPVDPVTGLKVPTIDVFTDGGQSRIQHNGVVVSAVNIGNMKKGGQTLKKRQIHAEADAVRMSGALNVAFSDVSFRNAAYGQIAGLVHYLGTTSQPSAFAISGNKFALSNPFPLNFITFHDSRALGATVNHISNTYNTGHMVGDIRRAYLADTDVGSASGSELVVNGTFDTDTTGWTIGSGAPSLAVDAGRMRITNNGAVAASVYQNIATVSGKTYLLSVDITAGSPTGNPDVIAAVTMSGQVSTGAVSSGTSTRSFVFTASASTTQIACRTNPSNNGVAYFDNITVKEIVADRSYKAQAASITGTLTKSQVALGSQLVAYSGWSNANYIRENWSADLDFGTGEWSVGAWVNVPVSLPAGSFPTVGSNIIINGTFDDASGWTTQSGWSINGGSANGVAPTANLSTNTGGFVTDRVYRVTLTISNYVTGNVFPWIRGTYSSTGYSANGTFTVYIVAGAGSDLFILTGNNFTGSVDNVSVVEIGSSLVADRAHSSGPKIQLGVNFFGRLTATAFDGTTTRTVTTTAAYNTATWLKARANYTTDGSLSISVNGQEVAVTRGAPLRPLYGRKNLFNYSHTFANGVWGLQPGGSKLNTTTADPDGGNNAITLSFSSIYGALQYNVQSLLVDGQQYTLSFWARRDSGSNTLHVFTGNGVSMGTYTPNSTWTRYTFTFTWTNGANILIVTQDRNASGFTNVQLYGMQLELNATATAYVPTTDIPSDGHPLTIGNSFAVDAPFPGSIALLKASATVPTAEQMVWMYEQEKQMFRDGAQVTLPDAGSIVDLAYDDLTDKWLAVSATNESEFSGLVRTSVTASPAGSYSKVTATSGIQLQARTTTNPGVDITIPAGNLREELLKDAEAANRLNAQLAIFDYVGGFTANTTSGSTSIVSAAGITYPVSYLGARITGTGIPTDTFILGINGTTLYLSKAATATGTAIQLSFTDFILAVGYEAKAVLLAGVVQREGSTQAFVRLFDGFKETIRLNTSPSFTALVQIQATRSIQ